jgi:hypothetical protein
MTADDADLSPDPLAAIAEERNELWARAHRAHVLEREAAALRAALAAREASLSWRMTAPLRRLGHRGSAPTPSDTSSASRS